MPGLVDSLSGRFGERLGEDILYAFVHGGGSGSSPRPVWLVVGGAIVGALI
jgi:hypothetical protein